MILRVAALCAGIAVAGGHGAMIHPKPRNAIDGQLPINDQGGCQRTAERPNYCYSCNCGCMGDGCLTKEGGAVGNWNGNCTPGTRAGMNGQPCLWFSQGCTIGCSECDNKTQQTVGKSLCGKVTKPTLPKRAWTVNRFAVEGSANDTCYQHPWRAPGTAPVTDPCGMAGGAPKFGPGAAVFADNKWAKQGSLGSVKLQKGPPSARWQAGQTVEVSWGITANHGGGYQYRIAPANESLTEAAFQRTPLPFTGPSQIRYLDGSLGKLFNRTEVSEGTSPPGSTWAMNPIPRIDNTYDKNVDRSPLCEGKGFPQGPTGNLGCRQFKSPACDDDTPWHPVPGSAPGKGAIEGRCSGDFLSGSIVDHVVIPSSLPPGDYIVGFRWDCEETAQIWQSCADVVITA